MLVGICMTDESLLLLLRASHLDRTLGETEAQGQATAGPTANGFAVAAWPHVHADAPIPLHVRPGGHGAQVNGAQETVPPLASSQAHPRGLLPSLKVLLPQGEQVELGQRTGGKPRPGDPGSSPSSTSPHATRGFRAQAGGLIEIPSAKRRARTQA